MDRRRREAPLRRPRPASASCRTAAPACRRHWSRRARRWCSCRASPESAGNAGRPRRALVQVGEDHPRLGDRDIGLGVDRAQPVHPPQRQDQRAAVGGRRRARRPSTYCRPAGPAGRDVRRRAATIAATSSVVAGARIAGAWPWNRPRQSVSQGSTSPRSVIAASARSARCTAAISSRHRIRASCASSLSGNCRAWHRRPIRLHR